MYIYLCHDLSFIIHSIFTQNIALVFHAIYVNLLIATSKQDFLYAINFLEKFSLVFHIFKFCSKVTRAVVKFISFDIIRTCLCNKVNASRKKTKFAILFQD